MRIALVGYGKMGREVERVVLERGHTVAVIIDQDNQVELNNLYSIGAEVAIDFTHPQSVVKNVDTILRQQIPVIIGTTGWTDKIHEINDLAYAMSATAVWSSNFSIGVNLMFKLNEMLAKLMNGHSEYDVLIEEQHHRQKADCPSGTALSLAHQLIKQLDRKTSVATAIDYSNRQPLPEELTIGSTRAGDLIGTHSVQWSCPHDLIEIRHQALSRSGFAQGAVFAAENVRSLSPGLHSFSSLFQG